MGNMSIKYTKIWNIGKRGVGLINPYTSKAFFKVTLESFYMVRFHYNLLQIKFFNQKNNNKNEVNEVRIGANR
jgi:bacteriorhodopsin